MRRAGMMPALSVAAMLVASCNRQPETVLVVEVRSEHALPAIAALDVTLKARSADGGTKLRESSQRIAKSGGGSIDLPSTFSAQVPRTIDGPIEIAIVALDAASTPVARGGMGPFPITVGKRLSLAIELSCLGGACTRIADSDGGTPDGPGDAAAAACGNGVVDRGESCDVALPAGAPGACPLGCDDHIPCTRDELNGSGCSAACSHVEITAASAGDRCCPAGATHASDGDCSALCGNQVIDQGETCDTAIARGASGACPGAADCDDGDSCSMDRLISAGTCQAVCLHEPIVPLGSQLSTPDGCCQAGASAVADPDCPAVCGNGVVEPGETCDTAVPAGRPGACPACNRQDACTRRTAVGKGCSAVCIEEPVNRAVSGDGCCPEGARPETDSDCAADAGLADAGAPDAGAGPVCGDGIVQAPEWCEPGATGAAACPPMCNGPRGCISWTLTGSGSTCSAHCELGTINLCTAGDGCCPADCTAANDSDCAVCGNGAVEGSERCDRGITAGHPGACPATCDDLDACTVDITSGSVADCTRGCTHARITACLPGDGCCPAGCHAGNDPDCSAVCGDGTVQQNETCDPYTSCPTSCPDDGDRCTAEILLGSAASCTARCAHQPIMGCSGAASDGCCPTGCNVYADVDCAQ